MNITKKRPRKSEKKRVFGVKKGCFGVKKALFFGFFGVKID